MLLIASSIFNSLATLPKPRLRKHGLATNHTQIHPTAATCSQRNQCVFLFVDWQPVAAHVLATHCMFYPCTLCIQTRGRYIGVLYCWQKWRCGRGTCSGTLDDSAECLKLRVVVSWVRLVTSGHACDCRMLTYTAYSGIMLLLLCVSPSVSVSVPINLISV